MTTDHETTGRIYAPIDAYVKGNCSQSMPNPDAWYYFGTTRQFKTCKGFAAYLELKYNKPFKTNKAKD